MWGKGYFAAVCTLNSFGLIVKAYLLLARVCLCYFLEEAACWCCIMYIKDRGLELRLKIELESLPESCYLFLLISLSFGLFDFSIKILKTFNHVDIYQLI